MRIDALDSRGGLAFASYRAADLLQADAYSADGPAVFIEAPDFRIENVSSRAIGLAAGDRSFQIGLFVDEAEVGFMTLTDLVEFVRRCYLRGAGGDGTDGGGGGLPFTPGEGPGPDIPEAPDLPYERTEGGAATLLADIGQFAEQSSEIAYRADEPAKTASSPWNRQAEKHNLKAAGMATDGIESLLRGAVALILEMLRRYPVRGSDGDIVRWDGSAKSLGRALWRLGLCPLLFENPYKSILMRAMSDIVRLAPQHREQELAGLCYHPHRPWQILDFLLFGFRRHPYWWGWPASTWSTRQTDPIDDLSRWPIPKGLSHMTGQRNIDTANVLGLIAAIESTPLVIARDSSRTATTALEIAMLAASHIMGESEPDVLLGSVTFPGGPSPTYSSPATLHKLQIMAVAESACAWLIEQMPQLVFPVKLEELIQETGERSYDD